MSGITVTMPLKEYEEMKEKIKLLEKEHVRNFVDMEYPTMDHMLRRDLVVKVNNEKIIGFLKPPLEGELRRQAEIAKRVNSGGGF